MSKASEARFWASTNCTVDACTFLNCGPVYPQGSDFKNCTISGATNTTLGALYLSDTTTIDNLSNVTVADYNGTYGVYIPASVTGTIDLNSIVFDNSGVDIFWAATSGTLTVSSNTATTFQVAGGTASVTIIAGQATLTITNLVLGSDVVIKESGTTSKLQDTQDVLVNSVGYTYTYSAGTFVDIAVYCEGYVPFFINGYELGATDSSLPVAQAADRNYTP